MTIKVDEKLVNKIYNSLLISDVRIQDLHPSIKHERGIKRGIRSILRDRDKEST